MAQQVASIQAIKMEYRDLTLEDLHEHFEAVFGQPAMEGEELTKDRTLLIMKLAYAEYLRQCKAADLLPFLKGGNGFGKESVCCVAVAKRAFPELLIRCRGLYLARAQPQGAGRGIVAVRFHLATRAQVDQITLLAGQSGIAPPKRRLRKLLTDRFAREHPPEKRDDEEAESDHSEQEPAADSRKHPTGNGSHELLGLHVHVLASLGLRAYGALVADRREHHLFGADGSLALGAAHLRLNAGMERAFRHVRLLASIRMSGGLPLGSSGLPADSKRTPGLQADSRK